MAAEKAGKATAIEGLGIIRLERQRAVVARQRLVEPLEIMERMAAIVERLGIIRLDRQRAVVGGEGLVEPLQFFERVPRL